MFSHDKLYSFLVLFFKKQFSLAWEKRTDILAIAQNEFLSLKKVSNSIFF